MGKGIIWGFAVITVLITVLLAFESTLFDRSFFKGEFTRLGVYAKEGNQMPDNVTESTLRFYENKDPALNVSYLDANEISHLVDVKARVRAAIGFRRILTALWMLAIGLIIILAKDKALKAVGDAYRASGIAVLAFVALLGVASLFFQPLFSLFHEVFFPQGNYLFSENSALLRVFTLQLQFDVFLVSIFKVALAGAVMFIIGFVLRRLDGKDGSAKHQRKKNK